MMLHEQNYQHMFDKVIAGRFFLMRSKIESRTGENGDEAEWSVKRTSLGISTNDSIKNVI